MFEQLPTEAKFYFRPGATIYMPGRTLPTTIRGYGHLTLSFEKTDRPELLSVGVRDLYWKLYPFAIPIDTRRDGRFDCIELRNVEIDMGFLDKEATRGTLNLVSGDLEITFQYLVTPKQIPLMEKLGGAGIKFSVTDRGQMNFKKKTFEIHSGVMELDQWPLAGALVKGGGTGTISDGLPDSTIDLNIVVQTGGMKGCNDINKDSVTICAGDEVIMCWTASSDVKSVLLDPGAISLPAAGVYPVKPSGPADIVYRVTTVGGNTVAQATVEVHFYQGQWLGPYQAAPNGTDWTIEIPATSCSRSIEVREVEIIKQNCLDWPSFLLEHVPPGETVPDFGKTISSGQTTKLGTGTFGAPGTWHFSPQMVPPNPTPVAKVKEAPPVCFRFRGQCIRR